MVRKKIGNACKTLFKVPAKRKSQKIILFGRIESELIAYESSGDGSESPQFSHYEQKSCHMMERMGYDLTKRSNLNFGKGKRALLRSFVLKDKNPDYYHKTEEDSIMYLCQSHQILNLKKKSIMTAHQQHHRGSQMSASVLSSKVSQ